MPETLLCVQADADADADADRDQTCPTLATAVKGHGPDGVYFMRMAEVRPCVRHSLARVALPRTSGHAPVCSRGADSVAACV